MASVFETLSSINVNEHTEQKQGLTYLSWAWAWGELLKRYPLSFYTVYEDSRGKVYHDDGNTAWVKTGVTVVDGDRQQEHIEYLPVMDHRNRSIPVSNITSFDVNKAIQRSLTKAVARHGLGLYIYAGEDLPEGDEEPASKPKTAVKAKKQQIKAPSFACEKCGCEITDREVNGKMMPAAQIVAISQKRHNANYCCNCMAEMKNNGGNNK